MGRVLQTISFVFGIIGIAGVAGAIEETNTMDYILVPVLFIAISLIAALLSVWEGRREKSDYISDSDARRIYNEQQRRAR